MTRSRRRSRSARKGGSRKRDLQARADKAVKSHETMALGKRDARAFLDAILNPPKPNARLREALDEHRRSAVVAKAGGAPADDPFAAFDEWNSPEDEKAFRDL